MIARFATLLAAFVLAVSPTVRAMCDVECVTAPASHGVTEAAPNHCGTPGDVSAGKAPLPPLPADECAHAHGPAASIMAASKGSPVSAAATAAATPPMRLLGAIARQVPATAGVPPDPPLPTRPLPLRI